jgi:hypothetical protein
MKCLRCNHDSRYKDRPGKICPNCKGEFAFEPAGTTRDPVTDRAFKSAIDSVSSQGQMRWGVENLYYEICRRKRAWPKARLGCSFVLLLLFGLFLGLAVAFRHPVLVVGTVIFAVLGVVVLVSYFHGKYVAITSTDFRRLWERWCEVHGVPEGVIVRQPTQKAPDLEADVADYSFDRAVICDRARTVDLLVANNFHFENNCAVLSITGYPANVFETVRAMLKRNPRLEVFALHDASIKGCMMAHRLANDPAWFAGQVKVIDVGLRPGHAGPFSGLLLRGEGIQMEPGEGITPVEAKWLRDHILELAVIRPEQVLKRLFHAVNRRFTPLEAAAAGAVAGSSGGNGGGGVIVDNSFAADAGAADGEGGDSFG